MKISPLALTSLAFIGTASAFTPSHPFVAQRSGSKQMMMPLDLDSLTSIGDAMQHVFPSVVLSADDLDAVSGAAAAVTDAVSNVDPTEAVTEVAKNDNGWFGFLAGPIEGLLQIIHGGLVASGMSADSWGVSITVMTVLIKLLTYPLTKTQLESTTKMQQLQPMVKDIQAKYQSNPDVMNQKIAEVYQTNEINPLAGCLPAFLQIPIFIGLYRAVLQLAKDDKLNEPYLWLPNLEGPVYGADPAHGSDWIFQGWHDGVPSLGWDDTVAFLAIPVILIASQFISQALMTPKDQSQDGQNQIILKVLPLMVGWFSLNVPAALGIYWITNNVITTIITLQIRSSLPSVAPVTPGTSSSTSVSMSTGTDDWSPVTKREKPTGFAAPSGLSDDGVKTITAIDAEVVDGDEMAVTDDAVFDAVPQKPKSKVSTQGVNF